MILTFAQSCFSQIEGFGEYGFPESHAASFALLVYVSAWIKCHYPEVFCAAILNSQPMGFYQPAQLVRDALKHEVEVRPVDVNFSEWDCTLEPASDEARHRFAVRLGFRQIQGLREKEIEGLVAARGNGYASIERLGALGGVSRFTIERLAEADAFRSLKLDRREALWAARRLGTLGIDKAIGALPDAEDRASAAGLALRQIGKSPQRAASGRQELRASAGRRRCRMLARFRFLPRRWMTSFSPKPRIALPPMPLCEHVVEDYVTTGLSLKEHPVRFFRERLTRLGALRNAEHRREDLPQDGKVTVAGLVLMRQMPGTAKGVVFMTLEDETDIANVIVWPKVFARHRFTVMTARFLAVRGRLQRAGLVIHVLAEEFVDLTEELRLLSEPELPASKTDWGRARASPTSRFSRAAISIEESSHRNIPINASQARNSKAGQKQSAPRHAAAGPIEIPIRRRRRRGGGAPARSDGLQIDRGRFPLLALFQLVADLLAFIEIAHSGTLDGGDMNEHIGAASLRLNETETLLSVEPLDCPNRHCCTP